MSTKKEMLGKESRKEKGHRRYSLLLLALLFIGFASYGTYAYFTSSTSTSKGHLTLNGLSGDYTPGGGTKDGNFDDKTGDGTTNTEDTNPDNNDKYVPGTDGKGDGKFEKVTGDEADNSNKFGEFDWVYIGNAKDATIESSNLLTATKKLSAFNKYITSSNEHEGATFNNVVGEDVFRKTVRLKVEGKATVPVQTTLSWAADANDAGLDNVIAGVFVKRGEFDTTSGKPKNEFSTDGYTAAMIDVKTPTDYTNENISVKPGQYLDIEIVVMVKKDIAPKAAENLNLAKIARQLTVTLKQNVSNNNNTSVLGNR